MRLVVLILGLTLAACGGARENSTSGASGEVLVFAAASLQDALRDVAAACEHAGGPKAVFNFAGSNTLAQQVTAGARADLFLSADEGWMDEVERAGRLAAGSRTPLLGNTLVVVARTDSTLPLETLDDLATSPIRGLAMGDPGAVPAGRYARAALGPLWDAVAPRVVPAPDARAALALVESDPEIAGIVYRTDAAASRRVRVRFEIPTGGGPPIRYAAAVLRDGPDPEGARAFLGFLRGEEARAIFARHGFSPLPRGAP